MRPPSILTRDQGYALTDTHQAVRLSVDCLVTHEGLYTWSATQDVWQLGRAERIVQARGSAGTFVWQRTTRTWGRGSAAPKEPRC